MADETDRERINTLRELCEILIQKLGKCECVLTDMERKCVHCPKVPIDVVKTLCEIRDVKNYIDKVFIPNNVMSKGEQEERDLKEQRRSDGTGTGFEDSSSEEGRGDDER